jgi:hypothetical protein
MKYFVIVLLFAAMMLSKAFAQTIKVNDVTKKEKKNTTVLKKTNIPLQQLRCDTLQIIEGVVADVLRRKISGYLYANYNIGDLLITKDYPIKVNLSMNASGYYKFNDSKDSLLITGNVKLGTTESLNFTVPKGPGTPADNHGWTTKLAILNGEINCGGIYYLKSVSKNKTDSIPFYFESGNIIYTDNIKPGTFSEGSILVYNSKQYIYTNFKWQNSSNN